MPVKVKVSYTLDDEAAAEQIRARIAAILPRHKVKKSAGTPPFKHLYFTPTNGKKSAK